MATALIRDLDDGVYERLKTRAAGNNRSLEGELREILVLASKQVDVATARAAAEAMRQRLEGRPHRIVGRYSPRNACGERPALVGSSTGPGESTGPPARQCWCPTRVWG